MASRATLVLNGDAARMKAMAWVKQAPVNTVVDFKESRRSVPQNARLWAILTDISQQHPHAGLRLTPNDWKCIFTAALRRELRLVPNLDGDGMVQLGERTSEMTKAELGELMDLIEAKGAEWGVQFNEPGQSSGRDGGRVNNPPPGRAERVEAA